jgi:hypothetical protein
MASTHGKVSFFFGLRSRVRIGASAFFCPSCHYTKALGQKVRLRFWFRHDLARVTLGSNV